MNIEIDKKTGQTFLMFESTGREIVLSPKETRDFSMAMIRVREQEKKKLEDMMARKHQTVG